MATIPQVNWPTLDQLLANPTGYGPYLEKAYYNIKSSMGAYGRGEGEYIYNYYKTDFNRAIERANNDIYNAMNSGTANDPTSSQYQAARNSYENGAVYLLKKLSPNILSGPIPQLTELFGGTMKDPQGTQVVGATGNVVTPSTGYPQQTVPATSTTQTAEAIKIGPTLWEQLRKAGITENDIERRKNPAGYDDIYVKPTSRFYTQAGGTTPSAASPGGTTASAPGTTAGTETGGVSGATGGTAGTVEVPKADQDWVNQLYQKYFDRNATSSELANWTKETPLALEQFLGKEAKTYGYTSKYFQTQDSGKLAEAQKIIADSNLPPDIKALFSEVVKTYPPGVEYDTQEIINTFNNIKQTTLDPYFKELSDIAVKDLNLAIQRQKETEEQALEVQRANAGQAIRQAKEGLEKAGMTFTGKGIEQLGATSAYAQPGAETAQGMPVQTPFGGMFYEGTVNQANRLMATSTAAKQKQAMQDLQLAAEKQLGSQALSGLGYTPMVGGITGSLETQKQQQYGTTLNQIIDNYRKKQEAMTNISTNT